MGAQRFLTLTMQSKRLMARWDAHLARTVAAGDVSRWPTHAGCTVLHARTAPLGYSY
jgi:hypothetical protein